MPRRRKNPVSLSAQERLELEGLIASGHAPARQLSHARILLKADEGGNAPSETWPDVKIADALEVSRATVSRVRERGSPGRALRQPSSIAGRKTPSPRRSSMENRKRI
jgi:hypothetical protein